MKLRILLFFVLVSLGSTLHAQVEGCMNPYACNYDSLATVDNGSCIESPNYKVTKADNIGGYGNFKVDSLGNRYIILNLSDTADIPGFVPPPGFYSLIGLQEGIANTQSLLVKMNRDNVLIWGFPIFSNVFDFNWSLEIDGLGNLYTAGRCGSNFQLGDSIILSVNQNSISRYLAKISSSGELQWVNILEDANLDTWLDVSENGNCVLTGQGNGSFVFDFQTFSFSSGFITYWNSDGQLQHFEQLDSWYSPAAISNSGVSYVVTNGGSQSVTKYDNNHVLNWQFDFNPNEGGTAYSYSIAVNSIDELYVLFQSHIDTIFLESAGGIVNLVNPFYDYNSNTGSGNQYSSFFLVKFSPDGMVMWHKDYYGQGFINVSEVELNNNRDELVIVGSITEGTDFNFDNILFSSAGQNFFVLRCDFEGNLIYHGTSISNSTAWANASSAEIDSYGQIQMLIVVESMVQFGDLVIDNLDSTNIPWWGGQWAILTIGYSNELGCTDSFACNYNPGAGCDNGTCLYPGCTDATACNYNSFAGCDDGLCDYHLVDIAPPICLVTVDEVSGHNMIVWEVPTENQIDQYLVFKETNMLNNYIEIGQVSVNDLGEFIDVNSNPQVQANKYKLAVIDSCGATSEKCELHKTVHLSANFGIGGVINLAWTNYEGLSFSSYNIYRGNPTLGFNIIGSVPSNQTSFTDISPSSVEYVYYIEVGDISCNSDRTIVSSKSNYLNTNPDNIHSSSGVSYFNVYCSVSNGILHLSASEAEVGREFSVLNSTGSLVYSGRVLGSQSQHDLSGLSNGVYVFRSGDYSRQFMLLR